jgi:hypothetical protein
MASHSLPGLGSQPRRFPEGVPGSLKNFQKSVLIGSCNLYDGNVRCESQAIEMGDAAHRSVADFALKNKTTTHMSIFSGLIPWYVSKLDSRSQLPLYSRFLTGITKNFIVSAFQLFGCGKRNNCVACHPFLSALRIHTVIDGSGIRIQLQVFDDQN